MFDMIVWCAIQHDLFGGKPSCLRVVIHHYSDVIMSTMASEITSLTIVYSTFIQAQIKENTKALRHWPWCGESTGTDEFPAQRATRKMFPFDDVIMILPVLVTHKLHSCWDHLHDAEKLYCCKESHKASVTHPTIHHFITVMFTFVHITVTTWCIKGYLSDAFWDL